LKCKTDDVHVAELAGGDIKCEACNDGIKLLNDLLQSPLVKGSIIKLLQGLCLELPTEFANGCVETVSGAISDIINFITDMTDHICPDLLHCGSKDFQLSTLAKCNAADLECKSCNGLHSIYNYVGNLTTAVSGVCAHLKNATQQKNCENLFAKDTASIVRFGQRIVSWTAAHLPLVPACNVGGKSVDADVGLMNMGIVPHLMNEFKSIGFSNGAGFASDAKQEEMLREQLVRARANVVVPPMQAQINSKVGPQEAKIVSSA